MVSFFCVSIEFVMLDSAFSYLLLFCVFSCTQSNLLPAQSYPNILITLRITIVSCPPANNNSTVPAAQLFLKIELAATMRLCPPFTASFDHQCAVSHLDHHLLGTHTARLRAVDLRQRNNCRISWTTTRGDAPDRHTEPQCARVELRLLDL